MCDKNEATESIGYAGGAILSICLIPQIYAIIQTKKVDNISYLWQFLYILGISLHLYYGIYYALAPIYIPTAIELFFVLTLLGLKIYYERNN